MEVTLLKQHCWPVDWNGCIEINSVLKLRYSIDKITLALYLPHSGWMGLFSRHSLNLNLSPWWKSLHFHSDTLTPLWRKYPWIANKAAPNVCWLYVHTGRDREGHVSYSASLFFSGWNKRRNVSFPLVSLESDSLQTLLGPIWPCLEWSSYCPVSTLSQC